MIDFRKSTVYQIYPRSFYDTNGDERYKNYYIFKKGKEDGSAPTNWESKFGGSAWEYVPEMDEYYLHLFHVK